jgi:hypothetical protein
MWYRQYPEEDMPIVVGCGYSDAEERSLLSPIREGTATVEAVSRGRRLSRAIILGMWHRQYPGEALPLRKYRVADEGRDVPVCCGRALKYASDYATDALGRLVAWCPHCGTVVP